MTMTMISPFSGAAGSDPPRRESGVSPPPQPRMDLEKLGRNFSGRTKASIKSPRRGGARGAVQWVPRGPRFWPRGPTFFGPRGSPLFGLLPSAFFSTKNQLCNFPFIIWVSVAPETLKTRKRRFSASQKLNTKNRDFVRKSHKSSKTCKNNDITMQITF